MGLVPGTALSFAERDIPRGNGSTGAPAMSSPLRAEKDQLIMIYIAATHRKGRTEFGIRDGTVLKRRLIDAGRICCPGGGHPHGLDVRS